MNVEPSLQDLFAEASELPGEARERFVTRLAAASPRLASELAALLARTDEGERRFSGTAWERFATDEEPPEELPKSIDRFRILRELGRGGMGRVFLAEEVREEFRRELALKVVDRAWVSPERERRFRSEIRILASLDHAGIARFLDGGRLADGTWFLALEYVDGEDLLSWASRQAASTAERVRLVADGLDAVAYAHDRGVVHRDLKPSNLLVDRQGRTRLLDFGVARLLESEEVGAALTAPEQRAYTPAYASPEQRAGEPVGPASDVYSAGVLLYELLTGVRPFAEEEASRARHERAVATRDPEAPSARLREQARTAPSGSALGVIGAQLDAICLRALAREPARRYASAREFATDLRRHLAGERIESPRPRSGMSRRIATAAVIAAAVAALVTGVFFSRSRRPSSIAARPFPYSATALPEIDELRRRFEAAPGSFEAGGAFAIALLREQRPDEAELVVSRLRQLEGGEDDPLVLYVAALLASLKDQPQQALVGYERAIERAVATRRGELIGQLRATRGRLLAQLGRRGEATSEMEAARAEFQDAGDLASFARVTNDLAIEAAQRNDLDESGRLFASALAATRSAGSENSGATMLVNLGFVEQLRGRPDLALARFEEGVARFRELDRPFKLAFALSHLAAAHWELGNVAATDAAIDEALSVGRPGGTAASLESILLLAMTRAIEAGDLQAARSAVAELEALIGSVGEAEIAARGAVARFRLALAEGSDADAWIEAERARRLLRESGSLEILVDLDLEEAAARSERGDSATAARLAEAAIAPLRGHGARTALTVGELLLARIEAGVGKLAEAEQRIAGLGPAPFGPDGPPPASVPVELAWREALASTASAAGRHAEAAAQLAKGRLRAERAGRLASAAAFASAPK